MMQTFWAIGNFIWRSIRWIFTAFLAFFEFTTNWAQFESQIEKWGLIAYLLVPLQRFWEVFTKHWPFFIILAIGVGFFLHLLVAKPRSKSRSEFDARRTKTRSNKRKRKK